MRNNLKIKFILIVIIFIFIHIVIIQNYYSIFISLNINVQNYENLKLIVNFILFPLVYIYLIYRYIQLKNENYVFSSSGILKKLLHINNNFKFHQLKTYYKYRDSHINKRKFDGDDPVEFARRHIYENRDGYKNLLTKFNDNKNHYAMYIDEYQNLESGLGRESEFQTKLKSKRFDKIERRLYKKNKIIKPIIDANFNYEITYTSPKGRNHYSDNGSIKLIEVENLFRNILENIKFNNSRGQIIKNERAKLTNGLRFKILKRDNYRCQLCGATQLDGIKLHIDHIFPVSKGGKTEESNLQVLCDSCNMGKSAKILD